MPGTILGSEDVKVSISPHLHSSGEEDTHTNKLTKPQTILVHENFEKIKQVEVVSGDRAGTGLDSVT